MSGATSTDVIASGTKLTLRWAQDSGGRYPARDFYVGLSSADQKKVMALFRRFAETAWITNREHFKKLGHRARGRGREFYEFKRFKIRFLGVFQTGTGTFLVCHGLIKKTDDLKPAEIERAIRVLEEHEKRQEKANELQRLRAHGAVVRGGSSTSSPGRVDRRGD